MGQLFGKVVREGCGVGGGGFYKEGNFGKSPLVGVGCRHGAVLAELACVVLYFAQFHAVALYFCLLVQTSVVEYIAVAVELAQVAGVIVADSCVAFTPGEECSCVFLLVVPIARCHLSSSNAQFAFFSFGDGVSVFVHQYGRDVCQGLPDGGHAVCGRVAAVAFEPVAGAVDCPFGRSVEVVDVRFGGTGEPCLGQFYRACLGSEDCDFEAVGVKLGEVGPEVGEHGGRHGGMGDALLDDELCGMEVFDLSVGYGVDACAAKQGGEEGLDAYVECEVESLKAVVGRVDGDACFPEGVDEGCHIPPRYAYSFWGSCAARGEEDVGKTFVGGRHRVVCQAFDVVQLGGAQGVESLPGGFGGEG